MKRDAEPGDKEVLMYGATFNPFFIAFFAKRPAPSITDGFEVLVHDVIAAITKYLKKNISVNTKKININDGYQLIHD